MQRHVLLAPVDVRLPRGALRTGPQQRDLDRQTLGQDVDGRHLRGVHAERGGHVVRGDDVGRHHGEKGRLADDLHRPARA